MRYNRRDRSKGLLAALVAVMLACAMLVPTTALALTTNKATARPNENGGSGVIGGLTTRLTWEGTVEEGEEVSSVTLTLPDDGTFDGSSTKITVLEGLSRAAVEGEAVASGSQLEVTFSNGDVDRFDEISVSHGMKSNLDFVKPGSLEIDHG
ncbi:MAG: hypothetical protein II128_07910, partial [Atopobiaceae bacterium]|nr:hypothetical protein [Atopobiaceae bacterium]